MTLEDVIRSPRLRDVARQAPLATHIDDFVQHISSIGYAPRTLRGIVAGAIRFGEFLSSRKVHDLRNLRPEDEQAFLELQPYCLSRGKYHFRSSRALGGARHLVGYLRSVGVVPPKPPPPSPIFAPLLEEWLTFLKHHRGLAPKSLVLYRGPISRFLDSLGPLATVSGLRRLRPDHVRDYVVETAHNCSRSERKSIASTLRIFLRFAWSRGYLDRDLSLAVQRVPTFKHEQLPRGPRWQDALRLLETPDRSTPLGRRDYAVIQMLLAYGVRVGQLCSLSLDDIDWRGSRIRFPAAKGGPSVEVPLLRPVGEALVKHLRGGRPMSSSRCVFLSTDPPFRALTTTGIRLIVARAFDKAGVATPHRGPHALRHAWATRMLSAGRPLKVIADLLGHRSLESTRIYAKVDYERLEGVGLAWPEEVSR